MVAAAAIVGGGAVVSGYMGSKAADKAADASAKGADAAAQVQWDMYDQSRKDQLPWLGTGQNALQMLAALNGVQYSSAPGGASSSLVSTANGLPERNDTLYATDPAYRDAWDAIVNEHFSQFNKNFTEKSDATAIENALKQRLGSQWVNPLAGQPGAAGGSSGKPDYSAFYESPDYQFAFQEGNRAVNAGLAARGLSNSGRALKELTRYGQGAASTQLNNYRNQLAAMAGIGQQTAQNLGQQGMATGQIVGQNTQNAADARASGYLGQANSWTNAINQGAGLAAYGKTNKWW